MAKEAVHTHTHAHAVGRAFAAVVILNAGFVVVEVVFGILSHSMALVADAGHNLSDVLGLVLAWAANLLVRKRPTKRRTYGYRRASILAALANAMLLLLATGALVRESVHRLRTVDYVDARTVAAVAVLGVVINGISALLLAGHSHRDLNIRSAFVHLAGDAAISLTVAGCAGIILATGWTVLDPIVSVLVSVIVLFGTWSLLKRSLDLALDAVPEGIDPDEVRTYLASLRHVVEVHDLHIWAMSTTATALTAHLVMPGGCCEPQFLCEVGKHLHDQFGIEHTTLQIDPLEAPHPCRLASIEAA